MTQPRVYLIGGGPGDPGLITLRGAELLGRADVVLYDGLVNPLLLKHATHAQELICVGKRGHGGSWQQEAINDQVVRLVREGKTVARLKGGDTSVFARTAEEIERLIAEQIPFEVVPGISTALAIGAYTGIPITHRDWASAVALVSAQLQPSDGSNDAEESIDWNAIANFPGTLVLYMGVATVAHWSHRLVDMGKRPTTPVALIRRCSFPDQHILICDLETVADTVQRNPNFRPPIIAVIGEAVRMAPASNWFSQRPLFGKSILVTSPTKTSVVLAELFREQGAQVIEQPTIEIEPASDWSEVDATLANIDAFDFVVFSSVFGVDAFFQRLISQGKDGRSLYRTTIAAVGEGTRRAIEKYFVRCDLVPDVTNATGLADALKPIVVNKRVLLVRNPDGKTELYDQLSEVGASCVALNVYRQAPVERWPDALLRQLERSEIDFVAVTSSNIARHTIKLIGDAAQSQHWLSLSPAITQVLRDAGCDSVLTSKEPTFEALVATANQSKSNRDD